MSDERDHLTLLQRLDLALAKLASEHAGELAAGADAGVRWLESDAEADGEWVAGVLGLRGVLINPEQASKILTGTATYLDPQHQEVGLITGLGIVLDTIRERAASGRAPEGWFVVDLFRRMTNGIARFRNNAVRRDVPWDAIVPLHYPSPNDLHAALDGFCEDRRFGFPAAAFDALHPVRQSLLVFWRLARMAPFPDFNVSMAFVVMDAYLLAKGYPMLTPIRQDRPALISLVSGPQPRRMVQFESRMLELVERAAAV